MNNCSNCKQCRLCLLNTHPKGQTGKGCRIMCAACSEGFRLLHIWIFSEFNINEHSKSQRSRMLTVWVLLTYFRTDTCSWQRYGKRDIKSIKPDGKRGLWPFHVGETNGPDTSREFSKSRFITVFLGLTQWVAVLYITAMASFVCKQKKGENRKGQDCRHKPDVLSCLP